MIVKVRSQVNYVCSQFADVLAGFAGCQLYVFDEAHRGAVLFGVLQTELALLAVRSCREHAGDRRPNRAERRDAGDHEGHNA